MVCLLPISQTLILFWTKLWDSATFPILNQNNSIEYFQWPALSWLDSSVVEHCTDIAEVTGSILVQAWIFFMFSFGNCLSCINNCDGLYFLWGCLPIPDEKLTFHIVSKLTCSLLLIKNAGSEQLNRWSRTTFSSWQMAVAWRDVTTSTVHQVEERRPQMMTLPH